MQDNSPSPPNLITLTCFEQCSTTEVSNTTITNPLETITSAVKDEEVSQENSGDAKEYPPGMWVYNYSITLECCTDADVKLEPTTSDEEAAATDTCTIDTGINPPHTEIAEKSSQMLVTQSEADKGTSTNMSQDGESTELDSLSTPLENSLNNANTVMSTEMTKTDVIFGSDLMGTDSTCIPIPNIEPENQMDIDANESNSDNSPFSSEALISTDPEQPTVATVITNTTEKNTDIVDTDTDWTALHYNELVSQEIQLHNNFGLESQSGTQSDNTSQYTTSVTPLTTRSETTSDDSVDDTLLKEIGSKLETISNDAIVLQPDPHKWKTVDIYGKDTGPKWYNPQGNVVTPPIIPRKLVEAFNYLPIFGRAKSKADLEDFQNSKIREFVGCDLNDDDFQKLTDYCSPDHLKTGNELNMGLSVPMPGYHQDVVTNQRSSEADGDAGQELCIVQKFKLRQERDRNNLFINKLKYRGMRLIPLTLEDDPEPPIPEEPALEPGKDLLFRIRVYRPFMYNQRDKPNTRRHSVFTRDVVMHGRQTLTELRDRLACPNDLDLRVDVSLRVDDPPPACAKDLFPSGFMFINNVFYVDERAGCRDTSVSLRAWAERRGLGRFPRRGMDAALERCVTKLGHPEVYVHQGNCEHLFTISEIRILSYSDPQCLSSYPCHTMQSQHHTIYCTTCAEFGAKWMVTGCDRVPFDPAFFCDTCLRLYLYKNGEKIGNFKVYSFIGNEMNTLKPL